jgi:hypothetical protein
MPSSHARSGKPKELEDVQQLAREKAIDAISALAAIHADAEQPPTARVAAANAILDRAFGKASAAAAAGEGGEGAVLANITVTFVKPESDG